MITSKLDFKKLSVLQSIAIALMLYMLTPSTIRAQSIWPQFRGPLGNGTASSETKLSVELDLEQELVWQTEVPGIGWSSPVMDGERIWFTTSVPELASKEEIDKKLEGVTVPQIKTVARSVELRAICLDLNLGVITHNILLANVQKPEIINPLNSYASPTPAIANGKVVCHFGNYGTWCLDSMTGAQLWDRQFIVDHSVGPGSSPVIFENNVLLVCDGMDQQYIACVNLESGKDVWKTDRPEQREKIPEYKKSFSTPLLVKIGTDFQAIVPGAQWIAGYDPRTGEEIWRADHGDGYSIAPVPVFESGLIVFATGYNQPEFVAIDPTGKGDVTKTHIRWRARNAPTMSSFVGHDGKILAISEKGILYCLDAKTGEALSRSRAAGNYSSSPLLADGKLYIFSREGFASILEANSEFKEVLHKNLGVGVMASPAVFGNDLIVRDLKKVLRIKGRSN